MSYAITRKEKGDDGYFTVSWSPLVRADKYEIHKKVPAMGGVAELYYRDAAGRLFLFRIARSWYGGLRAILREGTDPELERDERLRAITTEHKDRLYYRYSLCESSKDIDDVLFFLYESLSPGEHKAAHSGRYERIFLEEIDGGEEKEPPTAVRARNKG
jgi:hypothetical protein